MTAESSGKDEIARLHEEWSVLHTRLRAVEQTLSDALRQYARGEGPRPDDMIEDVEHLRAECALRFRRLMDAIRAQPASAPGALG